MLTKKFLNTMPAHPKLVTFGISLAIGMFDSEEHLAWAERIRVALAATDLLLRD